MGELRDFPVPNRAGLPEAVWSKLCGNGRLIQYGLLVGLGFGRRECFRWLEQALVVEAVDPFEGGERYRFLAVPGAASVDDLGLAVTVVGLG
ncbi:hypothetical protein ABIE28_003704 [Devosia sp. 2618]